VRVQAGRPVVWIVDRVRITVRVEFLDEMGGDFGYFYFKEAYHV
jgi:hypothetical protein